MYDSGGHHQRGQSELIGIVLLFALVITVSLTVVVVGSSAISDVRSDTMTESAEVTMLELQSKVAQAGSSDSELQEVSFAQSQGARPENQNAVGAGSMAENTGAISVDDSSGSIRIEVLDENGNPIATPTPITLGKITYERDGEILAYQGGGVFRKNADSPSSAIVSQPNFQYQYKSGIPTLSMPLTTVEGDAGDDSFTLRKTGSDEVFPSSATGAANPIGPGHDVRVTVTSEFYQSWGELFEQRTGVTPTYDHGANEVTIEFDSDYTESLGGGVGSVSTNDDIGTYATAEHVDYTSYDHRAGETASGTAPIYVRGDYASNQQTDITGSLVVEENVDTMELGNNNDWTITGTTRVGGNVIIHGPPKFGDDVHINGNLIATSQQGGSCSGGGHTVNFQSNVYVAGDVTCLNNVDIQGDLHVGGDLTASPSAVTVHGEIHVAGNHPSWSSSAIESTDPDAPKSADLSSLTSLTTLIEDKEEAFDESHENDNAAHSTTIAKLESSSWSNTCSGGCQLDAGTYYLDQGMTLKQSELTLDTSGGPIEIYTDGVTLDGYGSRLTVDGDHPVRVYNAGDFVSKSAGIAPEGPSFSEVYGNNLNEPDATTFWMYMKPSSNVDFENNPGAHVGVFCAPGAGSGSMETSAHTIIYGSLIGSIDDANNHFEVNFDEAILDSNEVCGGDWGGGGAQPSMNRDGETVGFVQVTKTTVKIDG